LLLVRNGEVHGRVPRIGEKPRIDVTERASEPAKHERDNRRAQRKRREKEDK
jgi:hypothetical protein